MKKVFPAVCLIGMFLLTFVTTASANFLIIGNDETYVLDYDETYDLVLVKDQGSLVVSNGATLTVTGCLAGENNSSFLFDNCTLNGRINIESSKKFHALNANIINNDEGPTETIINSDNIVISNSTITANAPLFEHTDPEDTTVTDHLLTNIRIFSSNNIYISNSTITNTTGEDSYGLRGEGELSIETNKNLFIENNSTLTCSGRPGELKLLANIAYLFNSNLNTYGVHDRRAFISITAEEIHGSDNNLSAYGTAGYNGIQTGNAIIVVPYWISYCGYRAHQRYMTQPNFHTSAPTEAERNYYSYYYNLYYYPSDGGDAYIQCSAKRINFSNTQLTCEGGKGGDDAIIPWDYQGDGGDAIIEITSTESVDPSLHNLTYTVTEGIGGSTEFGTGGSGTTQVTITPASIDNASQSTVDIPRRKLENFEDGNFWSPDTSMGWWDIDGTLVYQHYLVAFNTQTSVKSMQVDFDKQGLAWSLFGGFIDTVNPNKDFSDFNTVRLWVKGDTNLLVKLRDGNFNEQDVGVQNLSSVETMACLDFNYEHIVGVDLQNIDNILFFASPGDDSATGTFYIDSIELVNTQPIENFEDGDLWSPDSTLGWWDPDQNTIYQRSPETQIVHEGAIAMKIDYDKLGNPWAFFAGFMSTFNANADFSNYRKLSFWVYSDADILIKLRDRNFYEEDITTVSPTAYGWQLIEVNFSDVSILKEDIDSILFFVAPGNDNATGTIYIDDLKLVK